MPMVDTPLQRKTATLGIVGIILLSLLVMLLPESRRAKLYSFTTHEVVIKDITDHYTVGDTVLISYGNVHYPCVVMEIND